MQAEPTTWPDWNNRLVSDDEEAIEQSMLDLARYANPDMLRMLGIGTGDVRPADGASPADIARSLSKQLQDRAGGYTTEPFNAAGLRLQIIRTASELLEGAGTCVDFAVAVAAGCIREGKPVFLCATTSETKSVSHAFLALPADSNPPASAHTYECFGIDEFSRKVTGALGYQIVDPTPGFGTTGAMLEKYRSPEQHAMVHMIWVNRAITPETPFYKPPERPRSLGITTLLPDLPTPLSKFPSRRETVRRLQEASGTVVVLGETGVGKSTLALMRAQRAASGRGWFLDGSDRDALQVSFAAAEAQCQGRSLDNVQKENVTTLSGAARHRLAAATRPWVVVIDNADGKIGDVADLVPRPGPGDLVIITSTNPAWQEYATGAGWQVIPVGLLDKRRDLSGDELALPLPERLLLPGVLRLSLAVASSRPDEMAGMAGDISIQQLLRILFGKPADLAARLPADPVAAALLAAAIMPPEDVRQDWLASCVAAPAEVPMAVDRLVDMGVLETSRRIRDARTPDRRTFWLHRLIREAVVGTYADVSQPAVRSLVCQVLRHEPGLTPRVVRSRADLSMLADLLEEAVASSADPALPEAILPVLDSLEPRGNDDVARAAALAKVSLSIFPHRTEADWRLRATPMLAVARGVFRDGKADERQLTAALAVCEELTSRLAADQSVEGKLARGRAEAMRALLLRKRASRFLKERKEAAAVSLLEEVIEVLIRSFTERSEALGWDPPPLRRMRPPGGAQPPEAACSRSPVDDPDHHIDRAWFNVGGAYIDLAKVVLRHPPGEARRSSLIRQWSSALWGYAGSLSLRPDDTMYRAASLWGVALVLYLAALNGAVPLDLSSITRSEAIDDLWGRQDRAVLLTVAETCATQAHAIRANIAGPLDGDTRKTRDLLRKVCVAWLVTEPEAERADAAGQNVADLLREDLGFPPADWSTQA